MSLFETESDHEEEDGAGHRPCQQAGPRPSRLQRAPQGWARDRRQPHQSGAPHHPVPAGAELPGHPHVASRPAQGRSRPRLRPRSRGHAPGAAPRRIPVRKLDELSGPGVEAAVSAMQPGDVILLENSRFDPREKKNDPELTKELARLGDVFVNDAFSAAHRAHVTTAGLASVLPAVAGFSMEKEVDALEGAPGRAQAALRGDPRRGQGHRQDQGHRPLPRPGRHAAHRRSHEHHLPQGGRP